MMQKLISSICLLFVVGVAQGQHVNENQIVGEWYKQNLSLEVSDTLIFTKEITGQMFQVWDFRSSKKLIVSSGSIRDNTPAAKCFSGVMHYTWTLSRIENGTSILEVYFGQDKTIYRITEIAPESITLVVVMPR